MTSISSQGILTKLITVSVVSHCQAQLVRSLLEDIQKYCSSSSMEVILTVNIDEVLSFDTKDYSFSIRIIHNTIPKGFGENHNQAFAHATGQYFCVLNPDIRFNANPFPALLSCLQNPSIGVAAPVVVGENGAVEDSTRRFPTPLKILCKFFGGCKGSDYVIENDLVFPDWAGGMFLLFQRSMFEKLGGFDQRFFLYYEDVDLCVRLRLLGYDVALCPTARVIHHAHRSSHRSIKYLKWHLISMTRFFLSPAYWRILRRRWT